MADKFKEDQNRHNLISHGTVMLVLRIFIDN